MVQNSSWNAAGFFSQNMKRYLKNVMASTRRKIIVLIDFLATKNHVQISGEKGPQKNLETAMILSMKEGFFHRKFPLTG